MHLLQRRFASILLLLSFFLVISGAGASLVSAQAAPTPITLGQNVAGQLTAQTPTASYALTIAAPQGVFIDVLSLTAGFSPVLQVFDPTGLQIAFKTADNTETLRTVENFITAGTYRLDITGANGSIGQFALSTRGGAQFQPPVELELGQSVEGTLTGELPLATYTFGGSITDVLLLSFQADGETVDEVPFIRLIDAERGGVLASTTPALLGAQLRIPRGSLSYRLEVEGTSQSAQGYTVCVGTESSFAPCPAFSASSAPTATVTPIPLATATSVPTLAIPPVVIPPTAPCSVASATGGAVNIRSGPSTTFAIVTQLPPRTIIPVIGRLADNTWYQVNISGIIGWVSATVVTIGGQCGGVPVVAAPTFTPTATFTASATTAATATATATASATAIASATATNTPAPVATLNFSLPPNFGSTALTSGFVPDPFSVGVTSGGSVNVSYLGSGCSGFATSAPDFSVNYTSGAFPTLRFYFVGSGDTTMIINSPSASYSCVDDSFGTLNPTIDFNSPSSGRYDVWIGSFTSGTSISGTLFVTENTGNHP